MKQPRPPKRSVSPFGLSPAAPDPLADLKEAFARAYPNADASRRKLRTIDDLPAVPAVIEKVLDSPANDAPELDDLCAFLAGQRITLEAKGLQAAVFAAMELVFDAKTDLFLIDRQTILFAKERDSVVGRYFAPVTEREPGAFSHLINRWVESENPDRVLHFLDFAAGSANPTFDHYLLFSHPALNRVVVNKAQLRSLFDRAKPVLAKLSSPSWESDVRKALGI
jgi:hypothetical protein